MNSYKLGLYTLGVYIAISIGSWITLDGRSEIFALTVFLITCIPSILIWNEAIRKGMTKSIKDGVIVSMFYIVPYGLMVLTTYTILFNESANMFGMIRILIMLIFRNPMIISNSELGNIESARFIVFEPFIVMGILLVINIILYLFRSKNKYKNT